MPEIYFFENNFSAPGAGRGMGWSWIAILGVWDECRGLGRILELPLSLSPASSLTFEVLSGFLFARQIVITIITIAVSYNLQAFCKQKHIVTVCVPWGGFLLTTNIHILCFTFKSTHSEELFETNFHTNQLRSVNINWFKVTSWVSSSI